MRKALIAALLLCLAGHAYLAFALGLSVDEAHYALYGAHPALSYFDHPPLVGWVQIPFVVMGGADWMVRVVPLALWGLTAWMLWRLSLLRFSQWALVLFLLSPIHQLLGLALVPDSLLLPLTLWVMALTWSLSAAPGTLRLWLWLGVALGLAGLSKYTAVLLAMSAGAVLLSVHGIVLLKQRGLWLAVLVALAMISPVLMWNAQHDWVSFTYQLNHASGNQSWSLANVLRFDLVQLVSYGTLPLIGLVVFLWKLQTQQLHMMRLCLAFGLPTLLLAACSSGKGAALPHWTAAAWLALLPLAALGLQFAWQRAGKASKLALTCLAFVQALSIVVLAVLMLTGGGQWDAQRGSQPGGDPSAASQTGNPFADLHDWREAAMQASKLQNVHQTDALAVSNWTLASRLAWYARQNSSASPRDVKVLALDGKNKQFDMWFGQLEYGQRTIWMDWSQMPQQQPVGCHKLQDHSHQGKHSRFDFYLCGRP